MIPFFLTRNQKKKQIPVRSGVKIGGGRGESECVWAFHFLSCLLVWIFLLCRAGGEFAFFSLFLAVFSLGTFFKLHGGRSRRRILLNHPPSSSSSSCLDVGLTTPPSSPSLSLRLFFLHHHNTHACRQERHDGKKDKKNKRNTHKHHTVILQTYTHTHIHTTQRIMYMSPLLYLVQYTI